MWAIEGGLPMIGFGMWKLWWNVYLRLCKYVYLLFIFRWFVVHIRNKNITFSAYLYLFFVFVDDLFIYLIYAVISAKRAPHGHGQLRKSNRAKGVFKVAATHSKRGFPTWRSWVISCLCQEKKQIYSRFHSLHYYVYASINRSRSYDFLNIPDKIQFLYGIALEWKN